MTTAKEPKGKRANSDPEINVQDQGDDEGKPKADAEWFRRAEFVRPGYKTLRVNIDRDVMEWYEAEFDKYRSSMNQVLKYYMDNKMKPLVPAYPEAEKKQLVGKFDPEVIGWLKSGGGDYEARMSRVLRDFMESYTSKNKKQS